jgi:hypothetical protein
MPSIIKIKGATVAVTTANNVNTATLLRIYAADIATITQATAEAVAIGTFTMPAGSVSWLEKDATDTVASTASVSCTPVAYT